MPFVGEGLCLFARMGGPAAFDTVMDNLHERITHDKQLQPIIKDIDARLVYSKQVEYVSHVLAGTAQHTGRWMYEAHRKFIQEHGLSTAHFDTVAVHLAAALSSAGVPDSLVNEAVARIKPIREIFRDSYVPRELEPETADELCRRLEEEAVSLWQSCPAHCHKDAVASCPHFTSRAAHGCPVLRDCQRAASLCPIAAGAAAASADADVAAGKEPSLQERLGGNEALTAVVELFYQKILQDTQLAKFFDGVSMPRLKAKQVKYLAYAFGAPGHCTGVDLVKVHAHLIRDKGLDLRHFDRLAIHFESSLHELKVPGNLVQEATAVLQATRGLFDPAIHLPL